MSVNILLITVDQMRGDCLGFMGHPAVETPNLDMMKQNGIAFNRAYSAVPSCIAARAAILTGLSQRSHGRVGYQDAVTWNYEHTIAGEFAKAGYHTQCVGKMHVHPTRSLCGFHNVVLHDGYFHYSRNFNTASGVHWNNTDDYLPWLRQQLGFDADIIDSGLECNSWVARPWPYAEHLHPTNWTVTQSIDFLRRRDTTKPFFMMTSFVRPHSPLDPPEVYFNQYINEELPEPPIGDWADKEDACQDGLSISCTRGIINKKALKRARAAYYGLITHIDHQIGRLMQALHDAGVTNNTVILFTSDHGDLLGDHNLFRKSFPYEGSTNVPFIVYDPGNNLKCRHNNSLSNLVELRDIMPTLLNIAGIEIPESIEGRSLVPVMKGEDCDWREYIHGEHSYGRDSNHYIVCGSDKYIWYSKTGKEQYFDLKSDPQELHDLSKDEHCKERIGCMRNILVKELAYREEGYSDGKQLLTGRHPSSCLSHIKS